MLRRTPDEGKIVTNVFMVMHSDDTAEEITASEAIIDQSGTLVFYNTRYYRSVFSNAMSRPFLWLAAGTWKSCTLASTDA